MNRNLILSAALAFMFFLVSQSLAGHPCCSSCGAPCVTYKTVHKTIMVPTTDWVQKTVPCVRYHPEPRQCQVRVPHCYPVVHQVSKPCTVMVPYTTMKTHVYSVPRPVWETVQQQCTVMVPYKVVKQGYRTVCRRVAVPATRIACEDQGGWCVDACGCKHWLSNIVQVEIPCTTYKVVMDKIPYEYTQICSRPEVVTRPVKVCHYEHDTVTRQVPCTTYVPKQVVKKYNVVNYKTEWVTKTRHYTEMVPDHYEKVVNVPVCRMVPKTICCKVPVYSGCCRH